jgi:hypothetical protein
MLTEESFHQNGPGEGTWASAVVCDTLDFELGDINAPPICDAGGPYAADVNEPLTFDGTGSSDTDGSIVSYAWQFGDGATGSGATTTHSYALADTFSVELCVMDDNGAQACDSTTADVTEATAIGDAPAPQPETVVLCRGRPNPFNPSTLIEFGVSELGHVSLRVYDLRSHLVRTLVDADLQLGFHVVEWDGKDDNGDAAASGVYVYRLRAGGKSLTRKAVLIK